MDKTKKCVTEIDISEITNIGVTLKNHDFSSKPNKNGERKCKRCGLILKRREYK
jgi:hypothetical protein